MLGLDLTNATEQGTPLPDGAYNVICNKAELTPTKSGGEMIKVQLKVIDGPQAGRVVFESFNIRNANPQATQIGLGQLKGFLKASNFANPNRLESVTELLGLRCNVTVKTVDESNGYAPQARVKGYRQIAGTDAQSMPMAQQAPAAPAAGSNPF